jgi:3-oxocholest-4-en-26-oate---CoA ligase
MTWDLARLWHRLADLQPDRLALVHDAVSLTWRQFDSAAAGFAETLRRAGVRRGDVIALCLPNTLDYLVLLAGAMRCGATVCGVNYRYQAHELTALLQQLQPAAVCHRHGADTRQARRALPGVRFWHAVDDSPAATRLPRLLEVGADPGWLDSHPDDVLLKCTGGTTGAPLAVRWRIADILTQLNDHNPWHRHNLRDGLPRPAVQHPVRLLVASPLMHGSGLTRAMGALCAGGTVITLPGGFDPHRVLSTLAGRHATSLAIVGDAHAVPLADALDAEPQRWPLADLTTITSSGATWTDTVKHRLLKRLPHLSLLESLGSTEATGLGFSIATTDRIPPTGEFTLGRHARVFADTGRPAQPGQTGRVGVSFPHPAGLHPTGQLSNDAFVDDHGQRYVLAGDHVRLIDDSQILLLGRPAECINTGGEKVYAPEVADILRRHPGVRDALVVGLPHQRLGQTVTALVQLRPGTTTFAVLAHAKTHLAGYKVPATVIGVRSIPRTLAGKPDLDAARSLATQHAEGA